MPAKMELTVQRTPMYSYPIPEYRKEKRSPRHLIRTASGRFAVEMKRKDLQVSGRDV